MSTEPAADARGPMEIAVREWYGGEFSDTDSELLEIAREQDARLAALEAQNGKLRAALDGVLHHVAIHGWRCQVDSHDPDVVFTAARAALAEMEAK